MCVCVLEGKDGYKEDGNRVECVCYSELITHMQTFKHPEKPSELILENTVEMFFLSESGLYFLFAPTVHQCVHGHTHSHVVISFWRHLLDVMLSLAPNPNDNLTVTLKLKPQFESEKCLKLVGTRILVPIRAVGAHKDM